MPTESSSKATALVRPLSRKDLPFAAALHAGSLPHGLFPRLGEPFLRRYYSTFVRSPWAIALVVELEGQAVGMVVGTVDDGSHYRFVVRRCWLPLLASGAIALVRRPGVGWWFLRTRGRRYARGFMLLSGRRQLPSPTAAGRPPRREGVLTHVAVAEGARGSGAGVELVSAFVACAGRRGTSHLRLVTYAADGAAEFYERLGWLRTGQRAGLDGDAWTEFRLELR